MAQIDQEQDVVLLLEEQISEGVNQLIPLGDHPEPLRALAHRLLKIADSAAPVVPQPQRTSPSHVKGNDDGWQTAAFIQSLNVSDHIAAALKPPQIGHFAFCKALSREDLERRMREARLEGLTELVWDGLCGLSKQEAATGDELSAKFRMESGREMSLGTLEHFFNGLEALIGPPLMVEGSLLLQMKREHHDPRDAQQLYTSTNGVSTYPPDEWEFVCEPDMSKVYAERGDRKEFGMGPLRSSKPEWCRQPLERARLLEEMAAKNAALQQCGYAPLMEEEVVGGRLYTGPMFTKYNTVLRSHSGVDFFRTLNDEINRGNTYATTIHAINSCIIKLSRLQARAHMHMHMHAHAHAHGHTHHQSLAPAERQAGLARYDWNGAAKELPREGREGRCRRNRGMCGPCAAHARSSRIERRTFCPPLLLPVPNAAACCHRYATTPLAALRLTGCPAHRAQFGFSSTTEDCAQALHYAQGTASTLLEMDMGMVDKGADVSWLSQYPHEREVLWPPLMGIECLGTKVRAGALVVSARLSLNQMALTLEQVASKRQKVVCDLCVQLEKELEFEIKGVEWAALRTATNGKAVIEAGWLLRSWLRQVDGKPHAHAHAHATAPET